EQTFGSAGIGIAWQESSCSDFLKAKLGSSSGYTNLLNRLHQSLERAKHARFNLCGEGARVFARDFPHGICQYNGWIPADQPPFGEGPASCALSRDQIKIGESLLRFDRLLVLREDALEQLRVSSSLTSLDLNIFGYRVAFTEHEEARGRFGDLAR